MIPRAATLLPPVRVKAEPGFRIPPRLTCLFFATLLLLSSLGYAGAQVLPPDESLTDGPATDAVDSNRVAAPEINSETITAASPSDVVADSVSPNRGLGRIFRRKEPDSTFVDTAGIDFFRKVFSPVYPNPERAAAMSFLLPGAGQIYNRRFAYIKVPIIYGGLAALIYSGELNRKLRDEFQSAFELAVRGEPFIPPGPRYTSAATLRTARDEFDKNYQLSYIGVGILHLVQVLEAYTTSHLLNFDMDESLSFGPRVHTPAAHGFGASPSASLDASAARPRLAMGLTYRFGDR